MGRKPLIAIIIALVAIIAVAAVGYRALAPNAADDAQQQQTASEQVMPMPDLALYDADGNATSIEQIRAGKPAFVNFWTTWCPYCVDEMPDIQALYDEYGEEVAFIEIDIVDGQRETAEKGKAFMIDNAYTMPNYFDMDNSSAGELGVMSYPQTYLVDENGNITYVVQGRLNPDKMNEHLMELVY